MQSEDKAALKALKESAKQLLNDKVPWHERTTLLRAQALEASLSIRDKEIMAIVADARKENRGETNGINQGEEIHIPDQKWAWDNIIAANTFNLVVALQKVGKSAFISGFISSWKYGTGDFLDNKIYEKCPPVIIAGTDQNLGDWKEILVPAGLMKRLGDDKYELLDPVKKLWHRGNPIHFDDQGIETLTSEANKYKGHSPLVFADAYSCLVSPLGLNEALPEAAEPIHSLCEALEDSGATLVLLHHSSKSRSGERASNASRGGNAISAAASQIIQLHWLNEENKSDQRITLTTEGRNSKPVELVIEQVDRSQWISHGSKADIDKEEHLEKVESKLSDRQTMVLETIRTYCKENKQPLDSVEIAEMLDSEFGSNGRVKALATLNQLYTKGLINKQSIADVGRGNIANFYPREWGEKRFCSVSLEQYQLDQARLAKRGVS